jgi:hypothetical protein
MIKSYRNQMTPGMKMCIDHMRKTKSEVSNKEPKIENKPPAYNFGDGGKVKTPVNKL